MCKMSQLKRLTIALSQPHYKAGDTVSGEIQISFDPSAKIESIAVVLDGAAVVTWRDVQIIPILSPKNTDIPSSPEAAHGKPGYISDKEVYFHDEITLFRSTGSFETATNNGDVGTTQNENYDAWNNDGQGQTDTGAGDHFLTGNYNFGYSLPAHIPSSFRGTYGSVKYKATVRVTCRPEMSTSLPTIIAHEQEITVRNPQDDKMFESARQTSVADTATKLYTECVCYTAGNVELVAKLEKKGVRLGEPIHVDGSISNETHKQFRDVSMALVRTTYYKANLYTQLPGYMCKVDRKDIASVSLVPGATLARGTMELGAAGSKLTVPVDLQLANLGGCGLIRVEHSIQIRVARNYLCAPDISIFLPVVLEMPTTA